MEVDGQPEDEIEVAPGQRIRIGGTDLDVLDLTLPEEILAIRVGEAEPQELCAGVYSLVRGQSPELVPWDGDDALARIWSTAEGWCIQCNPGHRETVLPGRRWVIHGVVLEAVAIPINLAGPSSTVGPSRVGLTLVARHTSCHLLRPGRQAVVVDGQPGRVLSELCAMGAPADWTVLGGELWPELRADRDALRRNWDRVMRRLRLKLRENGVREDLVRADGLGNVELVLAVGDRVRDET